MEGGSLPIGHAQRPPIVPAGRSLVPRPWLGCDPPRQLTRRWGRTSYLLAADVEARLRDQAGVGLPLDRPGGTANGADPRSARRATPRRWGPGHHGWQACAL